MNSKFWKSELLRIQRLMLAKKPIIVNFDKAVNRFQVQLTFVFLIIRKLLESQKMTGAFEKIEFNVKTHRSNFKSRFTWDNLIIDEKYKIEDPIETFRSAKFIINLFIHSISFYPKRKSYKWTGVYFLSDYEKDNQLYYISTSGIDKIIEHVRNNKVRKIVYNKDAQSGKFYKFTS